MKYFRIPSLTGIENHRQATDRGTLRICEGVVPGAVGSLRSAPRWQQEFGMAIPAEGHQVLVVQDDETNKFAVVANSGVVNAIKIFTNENPVPSRIGNLISINAAADLIGSAPAYINDVGSRRAIVGNGLSQKKIVDSGGPLLVQDR